MPTVEAVVESYTVQGCDLSFVLIGERLRELREAKNWSKVDLQKASALSRFQTERIESGHSIPGTGMLKRYARALKVPLPALLYDGNAPQADGADLRGLSLFAKVFSRLSRSERNLLRVIALRIRSKDLPAHGGLTRRKVLGIDRRRAILGRR